VNHVLLPMATFCASNSIPGRLYCVHSRASLVWRIHTVLAALSTGDVSSTEQPPKKTGTRTLIYQVPKEILAALTTKGSPMRLTPKSTLCCCSDGVCRSEMAEGSRPHILSAMGTF